MLDPRIYRTGLGVVVLAVIVLAFSLDNQPGPLGTTLAPDAFNGQNVASSLNSMASVYPDRRPGSAGDDGLATAIAQQLGKYGMNVSTSTFSGHTVDGTRTLETVTGTLAGQGNGTIVIVTHRDALGSPAKADLSGTAVMLELARVLSGETHQHSIVLASISGSDGLAGATKLARNLGSSGDAVVVLGDLAGPQVRQPIIVPWSTRDQVASPALRNTVAAAVGAQAALPSHGVTMAGQIAHLAFPLTTSGQGPFNADGEPAVLLSVSGERSPSATEPIDPARLTALGRATLQTVSALDGGPSIDAPAPYLLFDGKVIPAWAIRLFVLALIAPVVITMIDGLARARRRGHSLPEWVAWVLSAAIPFVLALLVVVAAKAFGVIDVAPPGAVGADVVPMHAGGVALLVLLVLVIVLSFAFLQPFVIRAMGGEPRAMRRSKEPIGAGAGAAVLLVMCVLSLVVWLANPFAAGLMVIALHLWMWVVDPDVRLSRPVRLMLVIVGLVPPALVVLYYATSLGLSPIGVLWNGVLLIAGGQLRLLTALEWSIALGCVASVAMIAVRARREDRREVAPITVRGPITYAGPGSLGGTKSALRR